MDGVNSRSSCMMIESGLYPLTMIPPLHQHQHQHHHHQHQNHNHNPNKNNHQLGSSAADDLMSMESQTQSIKAKIMAHPLYPRLISAYVSCQKVGAPPEVVVKMEAAAAAAVAVAGRGGGEMGFVNANVTVNVVGSEDQDPGLDQFMEAYCEMLTKYEQEITKPFKEAMISISRIESQFKALTLSLSSSSGSGTACGEAANRDGFEDDMDVNMNLIDPSSEDRELKGQLLRRYSGYLGSLRQEFLKKRKKGKLPKEARQQLLDWWNRHYKWPYPSESQKLALAQSTGLDQKQINNWFINQRKRHWKPSDDMQLVVMDAASHAHHPHFSYIDNHVLGNPFGMDVSPTLM